jgi:hypothetical protein
MYLCCPRCERHFDTDTERDLDPNGIVCGRCVEALDPEGTGVVPAWGLEPTVRKPDAIDRLIALADEPRSDAWWVGYLSAAISNALEDESTEAGLRASLTRALEHYREDRS